MSPKQFLSGAVSLFEGDCREALKCLNDNSVDSVCCDPPYHLTSIVKRFGAEDAAPCKEGNTGAYARASRGFMGKVWDGGDIAFRVELWAEVLRVLKPGGHMIAFSGTRTYHRMAVAIEDAGFEIRDQLAWVYGSGFPKSHNISKGIDKTGGKSVSWFGEWLRTWRKENGIKQSEIASLFPSKSGGKTGCVANWELGLNLPTPEQFNLICKTYGLPFDDLKAAERAIIETSNNGIAGGSGKHAGEEKAYGFRASFDITSSATDAAKQWDGWGTALKPAWEPIVLARKPLIGTVVENVLAHGTGGLNIDGCRIEGEPVPVFDTKGGRKFEQSFTQLERRTQQIGTSDKGRFPANLCHDGSPEVLAGFPQTKSGEFLPHHAAKGKSQIGTFDIRDRSGEVHPTYGDSGSAARFFYSAKADADDRLGSGHPTVKPVDLMRWLVRLVTPKGGIVLDPFAGTGTTGEAAWREGMRAILIEREAPYQADIARRMALCLAGPDERARASVKARYGDLPAGPLFDLMEAAE